MVKIHMNFPLMYETKTLFQGCCCWFLSKGPFNCYVTPWRVGVSAFPEKNVTKVKGSTLLALRAGGWGSNSLEKKRYVTLERPPRESNVKSRLTSAPVLPWCVLDPGQR